MSKKRRNNRNKTSDKKTTNRNKTSDKKTTNSMNKSNIPEDIQFDEPIVVSMEDVKNKGLLDGDNAVDGIEKFSLKKEWLDLLEDIKYNKAKKAIQVIIGSMVLIAGLVLLAIAFTTRNSGKKVVATVSDVVEITTGDKKTLLSYDVEIMYKYKNKSYTEIVYKNAPKGLDIGDEITVKINPNNPREFYSVKTKLQIGGILVCTGFIIVFAYFYMVWRKIYLADEN